MMELFENGCLVILIPNSEAIVRSQQVGIRDSWVCGYYTNDDDEKKQKIDSFFNNYSDNNVFKVDIKKTVKDYNDYVKKFLKPFEDRLKYGFENYDNSMSYFKGLFRQNIEYIQIQNLYLSEQDENRYLKMHYTDDEPSKHLTNILIGAMSSLTIKKASNTEFIIYPSIQPAYLIKDEFITNKYNSLLEFEDLDYNLTPQDLSDILSEMHRNGKDKVASVISFGLKYAPVIYKNNYNYVDIKNNAYPTISSSSLDKEIRKGLKLYDSILENEFGINFVNRKPNLPYRAKNINRLYPFNQILYGAPGTGKTYLTPEYAIAIVENKTLDQVNVNYSDRNVLLEKYREYIEQGKIVFTTFHQSYGYEEFIQGIRPDVKSKDIKFNLVDGVFKKLSDRALREEGNFVIIIDEINRGNISKIFGELITLIEDSKRWGEEEQMSLKLSSNQEFTVPNNVFIIGTMNTADKSISLVDAALRRRFSFVEITPDTSNPHINIEFKQFLDQLNRNLKRDLGKDYVIGHSYFIDKDVKEFADIVNKNIIPLLYEYYYDDETKILAALNAVYLPHYEIIDEDTNERHTFVFEIEEIQPIDMDFTRIHYHVTEVEGVNIDENVIDA